MNTLTKVGAAVAVVIVGWTAGTVVLGQRVQAKLETQGPLGEALDSGGLLKVVNSEYRKSFFGATRTMSVELGCSTEGKPAPRLTVQQDIQHGPFPGFRSVGAARITTRLVLDSDARAKLKEAIGTEDLPFEMVTVAGFGGGTHTDLRSEGFTAKDANSNTQITLKPLNLQLKSSSGGDTTLRYDVQGYELQDGRGTSMVLAGLKGSAQGQAPHWYAMGTQADGVIERFEFKAPQGGAQPLLLLSNLKMGSQGSVKDGLYSAQSTMTGQLEVAGTKFQELVMKASLKNLNAEAYARLVKNAMQPQLGCDKPGAPAALAMQRQLVDMQSDLMALLPSNPEFSLDELSVTLEGKKALLSYAVGAQGVTAEELKAGFQPGLMQKVKLNAMVETSTGFLQELAKVFKQPPQMMDAMVAQGVDRGFIRQEGQSLKATIELAKGQALLNGKPVPLPGLTPPPAEPAPVEEETAEGE